MNNYKQDAIKYAWTILVGEENFDKLRLDENGYSNWKCRGLMPNSYWGQLFDRLRSGVTGQVKGIDLLYRPKSLNGLETNNGWHRIYDISDLPEIADTYTFLVDGREVNQWCEKGMSFSKQHTHWREVYKTPKPIY